MAGLYRLSRFAARPLRLRLQRKIRRENSVNSLAFVNSLAATQLRQ